jgi:hypothetical protein
LEDSLAIAPRNAKAAVIFIDTIIAIKTIKNVKHTEKAIVRLRIGTYHMRLVDFTAWIIAEPLSLIYLSIPQGLKQRNH